MLWEEGIARAKGLSQTPVGLDEAGSCAHIKAFTTGTLPLSQVGSLGGPRAELGQVMEPGLAGRSVG